MEIDSAANVVRLFCSAESEITFVLLGKSLKSIFKFFVDFHVKNFVGCVESGDLFY